MKGSLQVILVVAIVCGSIGGIVVASILKLLDNIVKVWIWENYKIELSETLPQDNTIGFSNMIFVSGICGFNGKYINSRYVCSSISRQIWIHDLHYA